MVNCWKIGSRWSFNGAPETKILSLFTKNSIVFVGHKSNEFKKRVKKGDYFAIADGFQIKAIAKALSEPDTLENLCPDFKSNENEQKKFSFDENKTCIGCRAEIKELETAEQFTYKKRGAFFSAYKLFPKIENYLLFTTTTLDDSLKKLVDTEKLKWYPWVGKNYEKNEHRILLIGESHYDTKNEFGQHLTREVVIMHGKEVHDKYNRQINFTRNIRYSVLGKKNKEYKEKFWDSVAFYNFVQKPMKDNKKRPSCDDYKQGWEAFFEVVKILKPTDIIFFGLEAMKNRPSDKIKIKCLKKVGKYTPFSAEMSENKNIKILAVRHPSAYFSWQKWHEFLKQNNSDLINFMQILCGIK